jgi:hypothetical protein
MSHIDKTIVALSLVLGNVNIKTYRESLIIASRESNVDAGKNFTSKDFHVIPN